MTIPFFEFFCLNRKYVLLNFLSRNLKVKYRRSAVGYLWTLLIPLAQVAIYFFVYKVVLKISVPNYLSFIVSGILPWTFFVTSVNESMDSLVSSHGLLTHAPVPIQIFPASCTVTNFVNFLPSIPLIFLVTYLETGLSASWTWLWMFPLAVLLFIFTYSLSFILACLYVYLRDLKHLIGLIVQLWLYVTPILFSPSMVPEQFRWVIWANPLSGFFVSLRMALFEHRAPTLDAIGVFAAWTLLLLLVGERVRRKYSSKIVEKL